MERKIEIMNPYVTHPGRAFMGLSTGWKIVVSVVLLVIALFVGQSLWHKISNKVWHGTTDDKLIQLKEDQRRIDQAKGVAQQALEELRKSKEEYAIERQKREIAEKVFTDAKTSLKEKERLYEKAISNPSPVPLPVDASTEDLCAKARELQIPNADSVCSR